MKNQLSIFLFLLFLIAGCSSKSKVDKDTKELTVKHTSSYTDDFSKRNNGWKQHEGEWVFANGVVRQSATDRYFPLLLLENDKFSDVDVSVKFKPISGRIDASGGVVFRAQDGRNYYIVRANALEDNFRLYYFEDGIRHQIASATVKPPVMGKYSSIRVVASGDHIQAYLNGKIEIDYHGKRYSKGYVGLWTKADSVTEFDNFVVNGE